MKNTKTKTIKSYSWKKLQSTNCRYANTSRVKNINKKTNLKKIALEEAIMWPSQDMDVNESPPLEYIIVSGKGKDKYNRLLDITDVRFNEMKKNNIICQVLSPTASGLQGLMYEGYDFPIEKAKEVNNYIHDKIKKVSTHFKAFATLPMMYPKDSAKELERCIIDLNMVGALVNGNTIYIKDGKKELLFYDTPEYDILWEKLVELDVPLYLHPAVYTSSGQFANDPSILNLYKNYPQLSASPWGFSIYLSEHIMRLILSGVFDRFPKLKIIVGHLGEILIWWAERFDHRLCVYKQELKEISKSDFKKHKLPYFSIPKLTLTEYLRKNIYITTSGWFSDDALKYAIKKVGIDRIMFSIDYPYEQQKIASEWIENIDLPQKDKEKIAYKNAKRILKI
jgi:2,3-dihydroxybenzoate decarboxylase